MRADGGVAVEGERDRVDGSVSTRRSMGALLCTLVILPEVDGWQGESIFFSSSSGVGRMARGEGEDGHGSIRPASAGQRIQ